MIIYILILDDSAFISPPPPALMPSSGNHSKSKHRNFHKHSQESGKDRHSSEYFQQQFRRMRLMQHVRSSQLFVNHVWTIGLASVLLLYFPNNYLKRLVYWPEGLPKYHCFFQSKTKQDTKVSWIIHWTTCSNGQVKFLFKK